MSWIGKNSYGIYLWHYILRYFFIPVPGYIGSPRTVQHYIIICISVGALSTQTIEKYFFNLRTKVVP